MTSPERDRQPFRLNTPANKTTKLLPSKPCLAEYSEQTAAAKACPQPLHGSWPHAFRCRATRTLDSPFTRNSTGHWNRLGCKCAPSRVNVSLIGMCRGGPARRR